MEDRTYKQEAGSLKDKQAESWDKDRQGRQVRQGWSGRVGWLVERRT